MQGKGERTVATSSYGYARCQGGEMLRHGADDQHQLFSRWLETMMEDFW